MLHYRLRVYTLAVLVLAWAPLLAAGDQTPSRAPGVADLRVHGILTLGGSVALADLVALWAQGFQGDYPGVAVTVSDAGGEAGLASLENGTADAVLLGSPPSDSQLDALRNRMGYAATLIPVAMDAVAVYVNARNPLRRITLAQLDGVFSATLRCGKTAIDDRQQWASQMPPDCPQWCPTASMRAPRQIWFSGRWRCAAAISGRSFRPWRGRMRWNQPSPVSRALSAFPAVRCIRPVSGLWR